MWKCWVLGPAPQAVRPQDTLVCALGEVNINPRASWRSFESDPLIRCSQRKAAVWKAEKNDSCQPHRGKEHSRNFDKTDDQKAGALFFISVSQMLYHFMALWSLELQDLHLPRSMNPLNPECHWAWVALSSTAPAPCVPWGDTSKLLAHCSSRGHWEEVTGWQEVVWCLKF